MKGNEMKSIGILAVAILMFVSPAFSAQWYISGFTGVGDPNYPVCSFENSCFTTIDYIYGDNWQGESDSYVREIVADAYNVGWCLMKINHTDYSPLAGVSDIDLLPDFPFDAKITGMTPETRNALVGILEKWGIPTTCSANASGYRDVIRCIGQQVIPDWTETSWGN